MSRVIEEGTVAEFDLATMHRTLVSILENGTFYELAEQETETQDIGGVR